MKQLYILLLVILANTFVMFGQVTIGSNVPPAEGVLLDLKQNKDGTSNLGLGLPRVEIKDTDILKLGDSDYTGLETEHTGLLVYNLYSDHCASTPIREGVYVWDTNQWQTLQDINRLSNGVYEVTDPRDGEIYLARSFGPITGEWMLENIRYVPKSEDGYVDYIHSVASLNETRNYIYTPKANGPYIAANHPEADWNKKKGLLYNWTAATNGENTATDNQGQKPSGDDPVFTSVRGVCPQGWHIPSDKEWNDLEREIYTNPRRYSLYSPTEAQFDPIWNPYWETGSGSRGATVNNATSPGHSHAMTDMCGLENSTDATNGKSRDGKQGGFNLLLVGSIETSSIYNYNKTGYYWSSSVAFNDNIWMRLVRSMDSKVWRNNYLKRSFFSVRCKKDTP